MFGEDLNEFSSNFFFEIHNLDKEALPKIEDIGLDKDNNSKETKEYSIIKNETIEVAKKRLGRKRMKDNQDNQETQKDQNVHTKYNKDNIIRKIQVHFQNFLICLINEIILNYGFKKKFLNIDYKNKKNVKKVNVENLRTQKIGQILCQNISTKYRKLYKIDKEMNIKLYLEVIKYESIKNFLSETYINIFRNIYYTNKRDINDYGLNIKLSDNVKTYQDLLEENIDDSEYIEKIKQTVEYNYLPKKMFTYN